MDIEEKYEDNQIVSKNEDGSYTLYDICYINDVENANIESKYAVDANESISDYNIDIVKRSEKQRNFEF